MENDTFQLVYDCVCESFSSFGKSFSTEMGGKTFALAVTKINEKEKFK